MLQLTLKTFSSVISKGCNTDSFDDKFYHRNWSALQGFPPLGETVISTREKFSKSFDMFELANQLLTRHSLYLAPWIDGDAFSL